jgi:hypothetical protein
MGPGQSKRGTLEILNKWGRRATGRIFLSSQVVRIAPCVPCDGLKKPMWNVSSGQVGLPARQAVQKEWSNLVAEIVSLWTGLCRTVKRLACTLSDARSGGW